MVRALEHETLVTGTVGRALGIHQEYVGIADNRTVRQGMGHHSSGCRPANTVSLSVTETTCRNEKKG